MLLWSTVDGFTRQGGTYWREIVIAGLNYLITGQISLQLIYSA